LRNEVDAVVGGATLRYWQVNQALKGNIEYFREYLCCPADQRGGHELMLALAPGDVLFHYNLDLHHIFGVSWVVAHSEPPMLPTPPIRRDIVVMNLVTVQYTGRHLSLSSMKPAKQKAAAKHEAFYEARTKRGVQRNIGESFLQEEPYLGEVRAEDAERRLSTRGLLQFLTPEAG
jgi:hypothetical protein